MRVIKQAQYHLNLSLLSEFKKELNLHFESFPQILVTRNRIIQKGVLQTSCDAS